MARGEPCLEVIRNHAQKYKKPPENHEKGEKWKTTNVIITRMPLMVQVLRQAVTGKGIRTGTNGPIRQRHKKYGKNIETMTK
jgi:hypothetical protein